MLMETAKTRRRGPRSSGFRCPGRPQERRLFGPGDARPRLSASRLRYPPRYFQYARRGAALVLGHLGRRHRLRGALPGVAVQSPAACRRRPPATAPRAGPRRNLLHDQSRLVRHRGPHRISDGDAVHQRSARLAEVDQQLRDPDPHLRDAGLGPEHRGGARRPARPRLCGVLCRRRLFLRAAVHHVRPELLDLSADGRDPGRLLGHDPRLPRCCAFGETTSRS